MDFSLRKLALAVGCLLFTGQLLAASAEPKRPECIAPASPAAAST